MWYYASFSPLMTPQGRAAVEAKGFFEIDRDGDLVTPLVPGSEECAFCHFEDGSCFCAIERQFCKGLSSFKKPISCSLYPIRVTELGGGRVGLNLHRWNICKEAYEKGRREGIRVYQFLRGPLTDAFGEEFYSALEAAAKMRSLQPHSHFHSLLPRWPLQRPGKGRRSRRQRRRPGCRCLPAVLRTCRPGPSR